MNGYMLTGKNHRPHLFTVEEAAYASIGSDFKAMMTGQQFSEEASRNFCKYGFLI